MTQPLRVQDTPNLRITFWGVQGSCPIFPTPAEIADYSRAVAVQTTEKVLIAAVHGAATPAQLSPLPSYGGETTCIEVLTGGGDTLIFDMGTGLRGFSRAALSTWPADRQRRLNVFLSHVHLDHRAGFPFASFCYESAAPFTIRMIGPRQVLSVLDRQYGIFTRQIGPDAHLDNPIDFRMMSAEFDATEVRLPNPIDSADVTSIGPSVDLDAPIQIGASTITPFLVYHGSTDCVGYVVQHGGSKFVFCTDHEFRRGPNAGDPRQLRSAAVERRLLELCYEADLAYFDGQYLHDEYTGARGIAGGSAMSRLDWGHSCVEDVIGFARRCRIKRTLIGHHDPDRPWAERLKLDSDLRQICLDPPCQIELAKAVTTLEI